MLITTFFFLFLISYFHKFPNWLFVFINADIEDLCYVVPVCLINQFYMFVRVSLERRLNLRSVKICGMKLAKNNLKESFTIQIFVYLNLFLDPYMLKWSTSGLMVLPCGIKIWEMDFYLRVYIRTEIVALPLNWNNRDDDMQNVFRSQNAVICCRQQWPK